VKRAAQREQGALKKKKEKSDVPTYLPTYLFCVIFFLRFLGMALYSRKCSVVFLRSSCRETAKKRDKKK
jgi:hypothetical protein